MKDIFGYEGRYAATKDGKIYSYHKKGYMKTYLNGNYYQVVLSKNKSIVTRGVHIWIALTFIPNPDNLPIVNHINGKTQDNRVENLEWVSVSRSIRHAIETGLIKNYTKKVCQIDMSGNIINEFDSILEAHKKTKINASCISRICKGKSRRAGGYYWKYSDDKNWKIPINRRFKRIQRTNIETDEIIVFESSDEAADSVGCSPHSIRNACNGVIDVLYEHRWKYLPREEPPIDLLFQKSRSWKKIPDYPRYRISSDGRVYSDWSRKLLKPSINKEYSIMHLSKHGEDKSFSAHRLVAQVYGVKPDNKNKVNHKNGKRSDNEIENLEWCTQSENCQHAHDTGLNKSQKAVIQYNIKGEEVARYKSAAFASKMTGVGFGQISKVCLGKFASGGGYIWRFESDPLTCLPKSIRGKRRVIRIDKDENRIIFDSVTDAANSCGGKGRSYISKVCNGTLKSAYGYKWEYA